MQKNILLKVAARALLVGLEEIPVVGGVIKIGRECWQLLRDEQEKSAENERIVQLEQAAAITPDEARKIAQEVVVEMRHAGHSVDTARLEAVQDIMAVMPAQIHERTRATLNHARRLGTQAVAVLPVTNRFKSADREAFYTSLFPQRRPQFQAGNALPHGSRGWRLERLIGAGGFGEVWLARKEALTWAVKFCQDETSAALLKRESKTLNELQQKLPAGTSHLVALLDLQLDEMPYWLAFEYVDGGTLESRIRLGAMDWPTAWELFQPILKGMAVVHDLKIVHRDLEPANILLDKNLQPRIADFGIGKILATQVAATRQSQRSRSMTTRGYGSLGYMSPEQAAGEVGHPADDVYALGVILWQMLMGTVQQVPEFPDDIADLVVEDFVKQALVRCRFSRRDKRPQTARELLGLLQLLNTPVPEKIIVSTPVEIPLPPLNPVQSQFQSQSQSQGQIQRQSFEPEMIMLKPGKFKMGSTKYSNEKPIHEVTIGYPFAIGKYPLTVDEFAAFVNATNYTTEGEINGGIYVWTGKKWKKDATKNWRDPGFKQENRCPVVGVSWNDAIAYCNWLSQQTGQIYRLPSEAEWEYACRAGTTTEYSFGDDANKLGDYAWFYGNSDSKTHPVGKKKPNPWGLYDMHGNVWEWCQDKWHSSYAGAPTDGSAWETGDSNHRLLRGCSWDNGPVYCRSANRYDLDYSGDLFGVRVVAVVSP